MKVPLSALFRADSANGHGGVGAGAGAGPGGRSDHAADWAVFVEEKGKARLRPVSRGHHNGLEVEVTSGLDAGTRVVLHPSNRVAEGVGVEPRE